MIHSVAHIPAVVYHKKHSLVTIIPLEKLVNIFCEENVIFSRKNDLIVWADKLWVRFKVLLRESLLKFLGVSVCRGIG